jgi:SAM-dependent methyltransferase
MSEFGFGLAHHTPTSYSDDIRTPFQDIGMGTWSDDQIGEFFAGKRVIDIGSGFEGLARRLYAIFGNSPDAPSVVNLNPQFTDWRMTDVYVEGKRQSVERPKKLDIEAQIKEIMEDSDEDFDGYMAQRTAVAGIVQRLEFPDGHFDVQVSTWAFPNVLYDCLGSDTYGIAGYKEILRTQRVGGVALLAPIRPREEAHVAYTLKSLGVPHLATFKPATEEGQALELRAA